MIVGSNLWKSANMGMQHRLSKKVIFLHPIVELHKLIFPVWFDNWSNKCKENVIATMHFFEDYRRQCSWKKQKGSCCADSDSKVLDMYYT